MIKENRKFIEDIALVYSSIFLWVLLVLAVLNHAFYFVLVVAYFV